MNETMTETIIDIDRISTGVEGANVDEDIIFTNEALTEINRIIAENNVPEHYHLRLGTKGGGCAGMSYILGFDSRVNEEDRTYKLNNLKFVMDSKSLFYLMGVTVDFVENEQGRGFVFNSPNDYGTCGCQN
jgi:iron-sulfur cluster assembly protein